MSLLEVISEQTTAYIVTVKKQLADGISFADAKPLIWELIQRLMFVAQQTDAAGPDKKEAVLSACEAFFDAVVVPFDIPWLPNWAEKIVEANARALIRPTFGPLIDGAVSGLKYVGALLDGLNPFKP